MRPERTLPDMEPLSAMVAAADAGRGLLFRVGAPLILVTTFSALARLGLHGRRVRLSRALPNRRASSRCVASADDAGFVAQLKSLRCGRCDGTRARARTRRTVITRTGPQDRGEVCARIGRRRWRSSILTRDRRSSLSTISEKPARQISCCCKNATESFDSARRASSTRKDSVTRAGVLNWSTPMKTVIRNCCSAAKTRARAETSDDLILFVPNDKRTYSMQMTGETTPRGTPRIQWLSNAAGTDAAAYRTALRQKARAIVSNEETLDFSDPVILDPASYLILSRNVDPLPVQFSTGKITFSPTTNINLQHMELSVKRSSLVFLLLLNFAVAVHAVGASLPQQRATKPTTPRARRNRAGATAGSED